MATRPDGRFCASRVGVSVPRQNGKNGIIEIRELFGMVVLGERILHTAHEVKTARKAFLRLASFFENPEYPEMMGLVKEIRRTNGQEAIILKNGGGCEFVARTRGSGRGFTVDVLVLDEAQDLNTEQLAALLPTISAAPLNNPQTIYTGTPPSPEGGGDVFTRLREAAIVGSETRLAYFEWSAESGVDFDDPESWLSANPALGSRLDIETVESERAALDDASFARERLGMWASESSAAVIDPEAWAACADEHSQPSSSLVLAVDISPDRSTASIGVAGLRDDDTWHVELIDNRAGTGWVVNRVADIASKQGIRSVVIDGASAAVSMAEHFKKKRLQVITTGPREMAAACGEFYDATLEGRLAHIDDLRLNHSVSTVRKRKLGDAWAFNRQTASSDITPVVSVTLALWGAQSSRVKRKKPSGSSERKGYIL